MRDAPRAWSPEVMAELRRLIPRGVIDALSVVGTAEQVADRLVTLEGLGVQELVMWPFPAGSGAKSSEGADLEDFVVRFAADVMPRVRRHESRGAYTLVD